MNKEKIKKILLNKKVIIPLCIIIIVIVIIILVNKKDKTKEEYDNSLTSQYNKILIDMNNTENVKIKDAVKWNESDKLKAERIYNDMKISQIELTATKEMSSFSAIVTNEFEKDIEGERVELTFIKKDGTKIATVETYFPDITTKGTATLFATTNEDIANAYDFIINKSEK